MRTAIIGLVALAAGTACAGTITFESVAATANTGALTTLSLPDGDGVTATFTRLGPVSRFDVWTLFGNPRPASWGTRSLSPFFAQGGSSDMFLVNFTAPGRIITGVRIEYGDYGGDTGNVRFQAFSGANGGGATLSNQTQFWNGDFFVGSPAGVFAAASATPILSLKFWGEQGSFNNSLYWDNLEITSIPENVIPLPHAAGMALAGIGVLGVRRRRA